MKVILTVLGILFSTLSFTQSQGFVSKGGVLVITGKVNTQDFAIESKEVGTSINVENGNFRVYLNTESLERADGKAKEYLEGNPFEISWHAILNQLPNNLMSEQSGFQFESAMDLSIDGISDNIPVVMKAKSSKGTGKVHWYLDLTGSIDPESFDLNKEEFVFDGNLQFRISIVLINMMEY